MSKPDSNTEAQSGNKTEPTFEQTVNETVAGMMKGDNGKWQFAEGSELSDQVKFAAKTERRRRDQEGAYTKQMEEVATLKAMNEQLTAKVKTKPSASISDEQAQELDNLKFEDPDAWRAKLNEYETQASRQLQEELVKMEQESSKQAEVERRKIVLAQFNAQNPQLNLTDEVIIDNVPPRIIKQLETGEIAFDDFLAKAKTYITTPKVLDSGTVLAAEPNMGQLQGSANPNVDNQLGSDDSYENEVY